MNQNIRHHLIWLLIFWFISNLSCLASSPEYLALADSADYYISREKWDLAESKIIEALRLEPANFTNSLLLSNLGLVQLRKGEDKKAIESFSLGLSISPSSTVLLNNRAHAYLGLDEIESAKVDLDRSLAIDSIQEWTLQTRGFLYLHEDNIPNALALFEKLQAEFPENTSVYAGLAEISKRTGDTEGALRYYDNILESKPEDNEAREAYIYLLISSDKYSEARSQINEALKRDPENPMFYLLRGYLHQLNYRYDEAQADKKIAISKGLSPEEASLFIP